MSGNNFLVPPKSWEGIEQEAMALREAFGFSERPFFPVMEFIEQVLDHKLNLIRFLVGSVEEMKGAEGHTCPSGKFIRLREDVYIAACNGEGRARFTAAHELGHLSMHTNIPYARVADSKSHKPYKLSEPQANQFAAALLMPKLFIPTNCSDPELLVEEHGVSYEAAQHRLSYLKRQGYG